MSGKGEGDPTISMMLLAGLLFGLCYVIFQMFHDPIMTGVRYFRFAEVWILSYLSPNMMACRTWLDIAPIGDKFMPTPDIYRWAHACFGNDLFKTMTPQESLSLYNITPTSIGILGDKVGSFVRWIVIAFALYGTWFVMVKDKRNKFKTTYDLEGFIKCQAKMWPVIAPIVNFIPNKFSARIPGSQVPNKIPLFAEAFLPEEWISFHRIPVVNGIPDKEGVRRAFLEQLGPRWAGPEALPPYMRALFAAFALKGAQKREQSDDLLSRIAVCWSSEKGMAIPSDILAECDKIIADPNVGGLAADVAKKHAYRTTGLLGVLKWARFMGGVLAPAQFIWLRAADRGLWYPMNNLGRRSFHTEGAGALAHFLAEIGAQKALVIPRVETAIVTLNQYMGRTGVSVPPREDPPAIKAKKK